MLKFLAPFKNMRFIDKKCYSFAEKLVNSASNPTSEVKKDSEWLNFKGSQPKKAITWMDLKEGNFIRDARSGVPVDRSGTRWRVKKGVKESCTSKEFGNLKKL